MILKAALPLLYPLSPVAERAETPKVPLRLRLRLPNLPKVPPETRLWRAALRGGPVPLGTPTAPYEPDGTSPLLALDGIEGLEVAVTTRSPRIVEEIDLLVDLDRRCSVTVDLLVDSDGVASREQLEAVARLTSEGIAVRLLCPQEDELKEAVLRKLLAAAREAGASDVRPLPTPGDDTFRRLRLEYGFPRQLPGRG
jgi:DNA repair photolyase